MKKIIIDDSGSSCEYIYPDQWKELVCFEFEENIVITGNTRMKGVTEASWWEGYQSILKDYEYLEPDDFREEYEGKLSEEQIDKFDKAYKEGSCDDLRKVAKIILPILYPEKEFEYASLRGSSQSDWNDCIFIKGCVKPEILADYYFGNVIDVSVENEDGECIEDRIYTDTEFWELEKGDLKEALRKEFGISAEEQVVFMRFSGYVQTSTWKEI